MTHIGSWRTGLRVVWLVLTAMASIPLLPARAHAGSATSLPAPTITLATTRPGNIFAPTEPVTATVTLAVSSGPPRQFALAESTQDFTGTVTSLITGTVTAPPTATPATGGTATTPVTATSTGPITGTATAPISDTVTPVVTGTATTPITGAAPLTGTITLIPGQPQRSTIVIATHGLGYYELDVSLTDLASGQSTTRSLSVGVMGPQAAAPDPASPFGVIGSLTEAYGNTAHDVLRAAQAMAAAGIRNSREEFNWQTIEPKPGRGYFDFRRQDMAIIAAHAAGIQVLGLIDYWGKLPQPDTTTFGQSGADKVPTIVGCSAAHACAYTSHGISLFAQFAAALVRRYKPGGDLARAQHWSDGYGITAWEVWNEPSTLDFWRHDLGGYADLFASMYSTTAAAIHTVDPAAQVMYDESGQNIDNSLASGGTAHDILALHIYAGGLDPDTAVVAPVLPRGGLGHATAGVDTWVSGKKPVWITETGYATDGSVTPRQQADFLVRAFTDYLATGVRKVFWFKFHQDGPGTDNLFSLVNGDFSPKPAYLAYATMAHHLDGTSFAQTVGLGTQIHVDLFGGQGATTAVVWSSGNPGQFQFNLTAGQATAYDLMDNPIGRQAGGTLTLPLSGDPVFLVVRGQTPGALAGMLQAAQITGIAPAGVDLRLAPGLVNNLPDIKAIVSAQTNVPISGTVTLGLPDGWTVDRPSRPFSTLQPGQSSTLSFHLESEVSHSGDTVVATATTALGQGAVGSMPATSYVLTYGHPKVDGTLTTWSGAAESDLIDLQPSQVVGIPGWTPQNLSARVYTMWDEHYFYLAADVHSAQFSYGPGGFTAYQGDWFQFGWGTDPAAWNGDQGPNRFNVTTVLTKPSASGRRYGVWSPWSNMAQAIKPDPATSDLIYTAAIPWSRLGNYVPRLGKQIAFDLLINQYENQNRVGWIQFTPGIRLGFSPSQFPLWTFIGTTPLAGLRLGGQYAPLQGTIRIRLATAQGHLEIHDGGMSQVMLTVNGASIALAPGAGTNPLQPYGATDIDLSPYLHAGTNIITASGTPARAGGAAVLSLFG